MVDAARPNNDIQHSANLKSGRKGPPMRFDKVRVCMVDAEGGGE